MKREEKNQISRQKILQFATEEFARQGYGLSSVNAICAAGGISKGILYHYFKDKDDIYLACLGACFDKLTAALQGSLAGMEGPASACLERYFDARLAFFADNPLLLRLFCGAVIGPPDHLKEAIRVIRKDFDQLNVSVLTALLKKAPLRRGAQVEDVVEVFRLYQDFINARYQMEGFTSEEWAEHERVCRRSLDILLYGVIAREEDT